MKKTLLLFFSGLCFLSSLNAQNGRDLWKDLNNSNLRSTPVIQPEAYRSLQLDFTAFSQLLLHSPATEQADHPLAVDFPLPDGGFATFELTQSSNFPQRLQEKYPQIRSFAGKALNKKGLSIRASISPLGLHAILEYDKREIYIDPYQVGETEQYIVYYTQDNKPSPELLASIQHDHSQQAPYSPDIFEMPQTGRNSPFAKTRNAATQELLRYDVAIACTGEYAAFWGGTREGALAAINVALDRINFIFIRETAIRLDLVADNDTLIYLDGATDPYTNGETGTMTSENVTVLNQLIGADKYGVGHVFGQGCSSGVVGTSGGIGTICGVNKARGASCQTAPNDNFYIGIICHELGHQFGALHTWNNCEGSNDDPNNYNPDGAFEPGSGTTIMSYAGACRSQNIQSNADSYYHVNSIEAIQKFSREGVGNGCAEAILTENDAPEVTIPLENGFYIPVGTPFKLSATATDANEDVLSYTWEQYNLDFVLSELGNPTGNDPSFRSYPPSSNSTRYFPNLDDLRNRRSSRAEVLPTYSRDLNFRCTVRDNNTEAGGVSWEEIAFRATEQAGPFRVSVPDTNALTYTAGAYEAIQWEVANTDKSPVNCQYVTIRMSMDGGKTFPIVLLENTPNDGEAFVHMPDTLAFQGRIMVEAADNIFFDISSYDFRIEKDTIPNFTVTVNPAGIPLQCLPEMAEFTIQTSSLNGYSEPIELELVGDLPQGAIFNFSQSTVNPGENSLLRINLLNSLLDTVAVKVRATSGTLPVAERELFFVALSNNFEDLEMTQPADGTAGIQLSTDFGWTAAPNADSYDIEIATNPMFGDSIIESASGLADNSYQPASLFPDNQLFYWRIRPENTCGNGDFLTPFTFHTASTVCTSFSATDTPVNISGTGRPTVQSKINVTEGGIISDLNIPLIKANYQPVKSLKMTLISPKGTEVIIYNRDCGNTVKFETGFDDDAPNTLVCPPDDGIVFQPTNPLSAFIGEDSKGEWILEVEVVESGFGASGAIDRWSIEFCTSSVAQNPSLLVNDTLRVPPALTNTITPQLLMAENEGVGAADMTYTLLTLPTNGTLSLQQQPLSIGSQFTQADISDLEIRYTHNGSDTEADKFLFVVEDGQGGFLSTQTFTIAIDENAIVGTKDLINALQIRIFPNPARSVLYLEFDQLPKGSVSAALFNIQGQQLLQKQFSGNSQIQFATDRLPAGLYVLKIQTEEGHFSKKISIQN